jgi:DNA-binding transcriptional LysR family regulator
VTRRLSRSKPAATRCGHWPPRRSGRSPPPPTSEDGGRSRLRDDDWVQGPSSTSPGLIRELCRAAGFEPRIAFESDDPLATRGIVAAGLAVSLVPSLTKEDTARDRNVRVLPLRDPPRRLVVAATVAGGRVTQATDAMVEALARAGARIGRATG